MIFLASLRFTFASLCLVLRFALLCASLCFVVCFVLLPFLLRLSLRFVSPVAKKSPLHHRVEQACVVSRHASTERSTECEQKNSVMLPAAEQGALGLGATISND